MIDTLSYEELQTISRDALEQYSGLAARESGPLVRGILSAVNSSNAETMAYLDSVMLARFISRASGTELDDIGEILSLQRGESTYAVDRTHSNAYIEVDTAYAANAMALPALITDTTPPTILSDGVVIRQGLRLSSASGVTYLTLEDVEFRGAATSVNIPVICTTPGSFGNIGARSLTRHNLEDAQTELSEIHNAINTNNSTAISSGQDTEDDARYRYRLSNWFTTLATSNRTAIRLAALSVPGVRSVALQEQVRGVGTLTVRIRGTSPIVTSGLMAAVQGIVSEVKGAGNPVFVTRPTYIGLKMSVALAFRRGNIDSATNAALKASVQSNIIDHINNYELGDKFVYTDLIAVARNTSPDIADVGISDMYHGEYDPDSSTLIQETPMLPGNLQTAAEQQLVTNDVLIIMC